MEITAYHEAGHAVLAICLGAEVSQLSIEDSDDWQAGSAVVRWTSGSPEQHCWNDLRTALAGPIAEMIYVGDYNYLRIQAEHAVDWAIVQRCLKKLNIAATQHSCLLETIVNDIYHTLRDDRLWSAVGDVAELLMLHETIDGETVHEATQFWLDR